MHNAIDSGSKYISFNTFMLFITHKTSNIHPIQAFHMFMNNLQRKYIAGVKCTRILILRRSFPATSYVTTTFHPTIGQCAHHSLSSTATPKLGMIPTRNKEH